MLTASLRLSGTLSGGAEVCRSYYLLADFGEEGGGTASIIPLSLGAPMPVGSLPPESGGEEAALRAAAEVIRALPGNQGLEMRVAINPE